MMLLAALQAIDVSPQTPDAALSPAGARIALLYRDGKWAEAHSLAQDLETAEGSFWHGIVHRQERDWGNAAYWFRRVGRHPVFSMIQTDAEKILRANGEPAYQLSGQWDPFLFIEWCKEAAEQPGSDQERIVIKIQESEWRHLYRWCAG